MSPAASASTPTPTPARIGHHPIIPPRTFDAPPPLPPALLERFRHFTVTDISDAVGRLYTMQSVIRPLYEPVRRMVGSAITVRVSPGDNWAVHAALSMTRKDDVLVVDWQGYADASGSGETALQGPIARGLAGVVIDGAWRDVPDLQSADLPIFGRAISPFSPAKAAFGEINVAVYCGGVIVEPGDVVVADVEGVVVIPRQHAELVADGIDAFVESVAAGKAAPTLPPADGLTTNARAYFAALDEAEAAHKVVPDA